MLKGNYVIYPQKPKHIHSLPPSSTFGLPSLKPSPFSFVFGLPLWIRQAPPATASSSGGAAAWSSLPKYHLCSLPSSLTLLCFSSFSGDHGGGWRRKRVSFHHFLYSSTLFFYSRPVPHPFLFPLGLLFFLAALFRLRRDSTATHDGEGRRSVLSSSFNGGELLLPVSSFIFRFGELRRVKPSWAHWFRCSKRVRMKLKFHLCVDFEGLKLWFKDQEVCIKP